jgi:hypothetical protein
MVSPEFPKKSLALSSPEFYNRPRFQEVDMLEAEGRWGSVSADCVGWAFPSFEPLG